MFTLSSDKDQINLEFEDMSCLKYLAPVSLDKFKQTPRNQATGITDVLVFHVISQFSSNSLLQQCLPSRMVAPYENKQGSVVSNLNLAPIEASDSSFSRLENV